MTEEVKKKKCWSTTTKIVLWSVGSPFILMIWWTIASTMFQEYSGVKACVDAKAAIQNIKSYDDN